MITEAIYKNYEDAQFAVSSDIRQCWQCHGAIAKKDENYYKIVFTQVGNTKNKLTRYYYIYFHTACFKLIAGEQYEFRIDS